MDHSDSPGTTVCRVADDVAAPLGSRVGRRKLQHPTDVDQSGIGEPIAAAHLTSEVEIEDPLGIRGDCVLVGSGELVGDPEHRVAGADDVLAGTGVIGVAGATPR